MADLFFPFSDLPVEMRSEVADRLDLPTRVVFCLTSKAIRALHWKGHSSRFDNYEFIECCIEAGYLELLKYAYKNGSPIEYRELVLSAQHNQLAIAKWISSELKISTTSYGKLYMCEVAARHGNIGLIELFFERALMNPIKIVTSAASSGNLKAIAFLKGKFDDGGISKVPQNDVLLKTAAEAGHLEAACALFQDSANPSQADLAGLLEGGVKGGRLHCVKYAFANGLDSMDFEDLCYSNVGPHFDTLQFFADLNPSKFRTAIIDQPTHRAFKSIDPRVFRLFKSNGFNFAQFDMKLLATRSILSETGFEFANNAPKKDTDARFECLAIACENGAMMTTTMIENMANWANPEQMQMVLGRLEFTPTQADWTSYLLKYLKENPIGELDHVLYFVENGAEITAAMMDQIIYMRNNMEILEALVRMERPRNDMEKVLLNANFWRSFTNMMQAHVGLTTTEIKWPKMRVRYYNTITFLTWTLENRLVKQASMLEPMTTVKQQYFAKTLRALIDKHSK